MLLFLASLFLGGVTLSLPMEATVQGTEVELGEIAEIVGDDPEAVARVAAIELGYAPAPGYSRIFLAERVREIVRRKLPGIEVRITGQRACRVFPEVEEVSADEILRAARVELVSAFAELDASVDAVGTLAPVQVPAGAKEHSVRVRLEAVPRSSGRISVPVELLVDGARYRTVWTTWNVQLWGTRPVLARRVKAGEEVRAGMFRRERVLLRESAGPSRLQPEVLQGAVATRDLAEGEEVTATDVHRPLVILPGESVFLSVSKGPIEAHVSAVALESGAVGDRIRLRTLDAGRELLAAIVSSDHCRIELGN